MSNQATAGQRFRAALAAEKPLQIIGAINANHALLAKRAGFNAIYLSGGGVAAGSLGLPDLVINTLDDVPTVAAATQKAYDAGNLTQQQFQDEQVLITKYHQMLQDQKDRQDAAKAVVAPNTGAARLRNRTPAPQPTEQNQ